jgi:glycosyltransferase involved in cell wall biosynthesis
VKATFERVLDEFHPELVLAPWVYPDGWAAVRLGHAAGLPVVIMVHGSDILVLSQHRGRRRRTIQALERADGIVAVSQDLARRMIELGAPAEKIDVVYNGIDLNLFNPGPSDEARKRLGLLGQDHIVLFIGNLLHVKGLDVLIDACDRLARDHVHFTCYLIGQGPLQGRLERQITRLGLAERVKLLGPKPNDQLPDWYRAADLTVLPSRSEGLPNVLRESLACGTPFVASRVGGIPELDAGPPSRLVAPEDPEALAAAVAEVLRARLRAVCPPDRLISWAESAEALIRMLQPLVAAPRATVRSIAPGSRP